MSSKYIDFSIEKNAKDLKYKNTKIFLQKVMLQYILRSIF